MSLDLSKEAKPSGSQLLLKLSVSVGKLRLWRKGTRLQESEMRPHTLKKPIFYASDTSRPSALDKAGSPMRPTLL